MLSKTQVVTIRKAIEKTYTGVCTITEQEKIKKLNKSTAFKEVIAFENLPCKLSFSLTKRGAVISQAVKIFISPDITVKNGSIVKITQNNVTTEYINSGEPAYFATHQEIGLELLEKIN